MNVESLPRRNSHDGTVSSWEVYTGCGVFYTVSRSHACDSKPCKDFLHLLLMTLPKEKTRKGWEGQEERERLGGWLLHGGSSSTEDFHRETYSPPAYR
jgi:hypothetical protein